MKNLFLGLRANIQANAPIFKYVGMWNNQIDDIGQNDTGDKAKNKIYSFGFPAVFFEFMNDNPVDSVGNNVQMFDPCDVKCHIIHEFYDAQDGSMELNLDIFDIEDQLHAAMQLFAVRGDSFGSSAFSRVSVERDYNHSDIYHSIPTYRATWVDNSLALPIGGFCINPPLELDLTVTIIPEIPPM